MVTYIYGLYDPRTDELRYIGKTINPLARLRGHTREWKNENHHRANWLRLLASLGHTPLMHVLDIAQGDGCDEERYQISLARNAGNNLVNATDGGDGAPGWVPSVEYRRKMSAIHKGRLITDQHRKRIGDALRGVPKPPHQVKEHGLRMRGRKLTPEHIEKVVSKLRGKKRPPDVIERGAAKRRGRKMPQWQIELLRSVHKGKRLSEEHRTKLSIAHKGRRFSAETNAKREAARQKTRNFGDPIQRKALVVEFIAVRKSIGLGRKRLSKMLGVTHQVLDQLEWGKRLPSLERIQRLVTFVKRYAANPALPIMPPCRHSPEPSRSLAPNAGTRKP